MSEQTHLLTHPDRSNRSDGSRNDASAQGQEFIAVPVSRVETVPWFRVALVFVTGSFSLPTFVTGIDLYSQFHGDCQKALSAIVMGNAILTLLACLCGVVGAKTRLHSYTLSRIAFGTQGAAFFNFAFGLSLLGWFGVNLNLFGVYVARVLYEQESRNDQMFDSGMVQILGGVLMTTTAMCGFRAFEKLSLLLAPIFALMTLALWKKSSSASQQSHLCTSSNQDGGNRPLTLGQALSSVAGLSIVGAIISSDYTRFMSGWHGAIYSSIVTYGLINIFVEWVSFYSAMVFEKDDLLDILMEIGLEQEAIVILVAGCWILNAMNLYSLSLSFCATFPAWCDHRLVIGLFGLLGTLTAFMNLLDVFLNFLFYLSVTFSPVAGVMVVDCLLLRKPIYDSFDPQCLVVCRRFALVAWVIGILVRVTGIVTLDAFLVGGVSYLAMIKCEALFH